MKHCQRDENFILTLSQIKQELRQRLPNNPEIHNCTVSRTLQGMLYRVKLARPLPAERNRPDVIHKRYDYASWFMKHAVVNHCLRLQHMDCQKPSKSQDRRQGVQAKRA